MIRIKKTTEDPQGLYLAYNHESVSKQILSDQNNKCYLCERIMVTNYQVDHLIPVSRRPDKEKQWTNLFCACDYCNGRKSDGWYGLADPTSYYVEKVIEQTNNFTDKEVVFNSEDGSEGVTQTVSLLTRLFNGKRGLRNMKDKIFYEYFIRNINVFQVAIDCFLQDKSAENRLIVRQHLDCKEEFLGFKYWIIKSHHELNEEFAQDIIWTT